MSLGFISIFSMVSYCRPDTVVHVARQDYSRRLVGDEIPLGRCWPQFQLVV